MFIKADCSLIRVVDDICRDIKSKEKAVNILFLTMGTFVAHTGTSADCGECSGSRGILFREGMKYLTITLTPTQ